VKIDVKYTLNYYALLLLAFVIPLHKEMFAPTTMLFILASIVNRHPWEQLKRKGSYLLLITLFILYAFSLLYTENITSGLEKLETKLSLFFLPLGFFLTKLSIKEHLGALFRAFVEGVFLGGVISLIHSGILTYYSGDVNHFFYSGFGLFHHTSYAAMYTCTALIIIYYYAFKPNKIFHFSPWVNLLLIITFSLFIGLLLSRTALLVLFIIHFSALTYWIIFQRKYLLGTLSFLAIAGVFSALMLTHNGFNQRVKGALDFSKEHEHSATMKRAALWKINWQLAQQNPIFGVGDGDVAFHQEKVYFEKGNQVLKKYSLNAHNQYLQTLVALGWIGLFALLTPYIYLSIRHYRSRFWLPIFILCVILINFVTESMLETQSGVAFISFYLALFWELTHNSNTTLPKIV
jgi:O-antigen ligase